MTSEARVLDSTAWWEIAAGTATGKALHRKYAEGSSRLYASALVLGELAAKVADEGLRDALLAEIRSAATIIPVSGEIAEAGGRLRARLRASDESASLADGIHLATARSIDAKLVSNDMAFRREKDVEWPR